MVNPDDFVTKTDTELVKLTLQNQDYYACLIKRYEARLTRYIHRISNFSDDETEDVLQEVFIKAYQSLNDFDQKLKFSSWVYRITHNQVISTFRKKQARPQNVIAVEDEKIVNRFAADIDLADDLDKKYSVEELNRALSSLDYKYREILVLRYLEGQSYEEISNILKRPVNTVGTMIKRAKDKLAEKMK